MADSAYVAELAMRDSEVAREPARHSVVVRVTHWINTLSFVGLVVSGVAIILAHPRFYWGEAGALGAPSLFDLPLPFVLVGQTGWGRYLHFLAAWVFVLNGIFYVSSGVLARLFRKGSAYETPQRITYMVVVFLLAPLMVWTGLAMSPAITSVFPGVVTVFGGQQSARTIHFIVASMLVLFLALHVVMVWRNGFTKLVMGMIK